MIFLKFVPPKIVYIRFLSKSWY